MFEALAKILLCLLLCVRSQEFTTHCLETMLIESECRLPSGHRCL